MDIQRRAKRLTDSLGRCPTCMRQAFTTAFIATLATLAATFFAAPVTMVAAIGVIAMGLTLLWLSHAWMFALCRVKANPTHAETQERSGVWRRRDVLAAFWHVLIFTALTSSIAKPLGAQGCNCYNEEGCRCPDDFPQCVFNPSTGEAICCGYDNAGCAGPSMTWCCPGNTSCYGTEGQCYGSN